MGRRPSIRFVRRGARRGGATGGPSEKKGKTNGGREVQQEGSQCCPLYRRCTFKASTLWSTIKCQEQSQFAMELGSRALCPTAKKPSSPVVDCRSSSLGASFVATRNPLHQGCDLLIVHLGGRSALPTNWEVKSVGQPLGNQVS